jgi:hypothetical protein
LRALRPKRRNVPLNRGGLLTRRQNPRYVGAATSNAGSVGLK